MNTYLNNQQLQNELTTKIYRSMIKFSGAKPIPLELNEKNNFEIDIELLSSLIKSIFFLIIFNKSKSKIYFYRMWGIINAMIGKESWYRPKI